MTRPLRSVYFTLVLVVPAIVSLLAAADDAKFDPLADVARALAKMNVKPGDSPQAGRSQYRNNIAAAGTIPTECDLKTGTNVKWSARLGSDTFSTPVVANGKLFVGTNNSGAYLKRYPRNKDVSVLLCFDEKSGEFLWQDSNEKLQGEDSNDYAHAGICSSPYVEGNRLWYVTNRNEVVCLDTEGFRDGKNDGPFQGEPNENKDEADVV